MSQPIINQYKLNAKNAREVGASSVINERGAYVGAFIRAEQVTSNRGTQGIEFDFRADNGATARFLTVWTMNGDGKELGGRKVIDAIMTCLGVREIAASEATVHKYSQESRKDEPVRAIVFPALMNKPIGLVLNREEYLPNSGNETKWKNNIVCPFEAATRRIAIERLDNLPAEGLDRILTMLRDRPLKPAQGTTRTSGGDGGRQATGSTGSGFDDMDDDIPF